MVAPKRSAYDFEIVGGAAQSEGERESDKAIAEQTRLPSIKRRATIAIDAAAHTEHTRHSNRNRTPRIDHEKGVFGVFGVFVS